MSRFGSLRLAVVLLVVVAVLLGGATTASAATGASVLTATNTGASYAPTFTGNGELGVRVPPAGQGYAGGTVPAQSELAGFYAKPTHGKPADQVQQRASVPTWRPAIGPGCATAAGPCSVRRRRSGRPG